MPTTIPQPGFAKHRWIFQIEKIVNRSHHCLLPICTIYNLGFDFLSLLRSHNISILCSHACTIINLVQIPPYSTLQKLDYLEVSKKGLLPDVFSFLSSALAPQAIYPSQKRHLRKIRSVISFWFYSILESFILIDLLRRINLEFLYSFSSLS